MKRCTGSNKVLLARNTVQDSFKKTVPLEMSGFRCDKASSLLFPEFSRTQIQEFIARKILLCNEKEIKKRDCVLAGDIIALSKESVKKPTALLVPYKIDFTILVINALILIL